TSSSSGGDATASLDGAGATFPMPIYQKWFADYQKSHGVRINYNGLGSAAGINKVTDGTVDFGASDNAMKDEQIAKIAKGVQLVPATAGAVVVGYTLPELKEPLKLSRDALPASSSARSPSGMTRPSPRITPARPVPRLASSTAPRGAGRPSSSRRI